MEAERELCAGGCGPHCQSAHMVVWTDDTGRTHVFGPPTPPPPLEQELREMYPREQYEPPPEHWAAPADMNEDLGRPRNNGLGEKVQNGDGWPSCRSWPRSRQRR